MNEFMVKTEDRALQETLLNTHDWGKPSNGSEREWFFERQCYQCDHDHFMSHVDEERGGCPLILEMMVGFPVRQWVEDESNHLVCGSFFPCERCKGDADE